MPTKQKDSLESSVIKTVAIPNFTDVIGDLAELGLDSILEEGLAKELPFVGALVKLHSIGVGIRERLFLSKVFKFLIALRSIPQNEREHWYEKLDRDPKEQSRVGEAILLILDRLDDMEKPEIIGRLFKAYIQETIDFSTFQRLSTMVDRCHLPDLKQAAPHGFVSQDVAANLATIGVMNISGVIASGAPTIIVKPSVTVRIGLNANGLLTNFNQPLTCLERMFGYTLVNRTYVQR